MELSLDWRYAPSLLGAGVHSEIPKAWRSLPACSESVYSLPCLACLAAPCPALPSPAKPRLPCRAWPYRALPRLPCLPCHAAPSPAVPRLPCLPCLASPRPASPSLPRLALSLKRLDCAVCCMQCLQGNGDAGEPVAVRIVLLLGYVLQCPGGGFGGLGAL